MYKTNRKKIKAFIKKIRKHNVDIFSYTALSGIIILFLLPSFLLKDLTGDFIGQEVAWYHYTYINLKDGIIPYWSPYALSGVQHILKPELAIAHPFTILTILLNFLFNLQEQIGMTGQLMEYVSILSLCIGALGIYILTRKIFFISPIASIFAGLAYSLNPFTLVQIHSTSVLHGVNLLPWLIYALICFIRKPTFSTFFILSLVNYLLLIGYSYHYIYFFLMQLGLVTFYGIKRTLFFFISFFLSILLSSFFLFSYLDIYMHSPRNVNNYDQSFHSFASLNPIKITEIINPVSLTTHISTSNFADLFAGPTFTWGTFTFLFFVYGLLSLKKRNINIWIVCVLIISLLYSFGGYIYAHNFFGSFIPLILKFRFHARAFMCAIFAGSLLIGFGIYSIQKQIRMKYIEFFLWVFVFLLSTGLIFGQLFIPHRLIANPEMVRGVTITLLFLSCSLIITALTLRIGKKELLFLALIPMLIEYNLFFQNYTDFFTKNITYDQFYKINSLVPEIPDNNNLFRIYFEDNQFAYNTSLHKIFNMYGYENNPYSSSGERYHRYGMFRYYQISNLKYLVTTNDNWQEHNTEVEKIKSIQPQTLPKEIFFHGADKTHYIYRIKNYLPRFFVPDQVIPCNNSTCLSKDNPPKTVVAKDITKTHRNPQKNVSIHVDNYTTNTVTLTIQTPEKTFVSSSENNDRGWSISINGYPSKIHDTSNGMRGFIVDKGKSKIIMSYFPPYLVPGIITSGIGLIVLYLIYKFKIIQRVFKDNEVKI